MTSKTVSASREKVGKRARTDYRLLFAGIGIWLGALFFYFSNIWILALELTCLGVYFFSHRRSSAALVLILAMITGSSTLAFREIRLSQNLITTAAISQSEVLVTGIVKSDPTRTKSRVFGSRLSLSQETFLLRVQQIKLDQTSYFLRIPIRIISEKPLHLLPGQKITIEGRLTLTRERKVSALLLTKGFSIALSDPSILGRVTGEIRSGLREVSAEKNSDAGSLIPGIVLGDRSLQSPSFILAMRRVGFSHLTAVSGANFSIVSAFLLWLTQWIFRKRRSRIIFTALVLFGFVFLVRPSPSVLRAGVMAAVVLFARSEGEKSHSVPALGLAISLLLLLDPFQGVDPGFVLSVLATSGIIFLAPSITKKLTRWLPEPIAQMVAISTSATLMCTPVIVGLSGQISLVTIPANVVVAPLIAPLTILGFIAALISPFSGLLSHFIINLAYPFSWCITTLAQWAGQFPVIGLTRGWIGAGASLLATTLGCWIFIRWKKARKKILIVVVIFFTVQYLPVAQWPGSGWGALQCDVGQGDALLIATAPRHAILLDVGPDLHLIDRCLSAAGITTIDLLVLSHFHADHVEGLSGVMKGRIISQLWISPNAQPIMESERVKELLLNVPTTIVSKAMVARLSNQMTIRVLWPMQTIRTFESLPGDGSAVNNSSITLLIEIGTVKIFVGGDIEPPAQADILRSNQIPRVDILKVSHHGSAYQDQGLMKALSPKVAVISVGAGNSYGHPSLETIASLENLGAVVKRTDRDGALLLSWRLDTVTGQARIDIRSAPKGWWRVRWS